MFIIKQYTKVAFHEEVSSQIGVGFPFLHGAKHYVECNAPCKVEWKSDLLTNSISLKDRSIRYEIVKKNET